MRIRFISPRASAYLAASGKAKPAINPGCKVVYSFLIILILLSSRAHTQSIPGEITVYPRVTTSAVSGDADDPAIWIHPFDPSKSLIIGTDKGTGALYVWDMNGQQLQNIPVGDDANNVDVRYDMLVGGQSLDICVVNKKNPSGFVVFKIDPAAGTLSNITTSGGILAPELKNPYGLALYRRPGDGAMFVFGTTNGGDLKNLHQYRLLDDGAGKVKGMHVRVFGSNYVSGVMEGLVADDEFGYIYAAEEDCCVHKFYADPDLNNNTQLAEFAHDDGIDPDREGLGLYACADGTGYLVLSSQGNKRAKIYRREGDPGNPHSHTLVTTIYTPNASSTDGLDVTNRPAGPNFPNGLMAKHDGATKKFALFAWEDIALTYLTICPDDGGACDVAADFSGNATSGCGSLAVNFTDLSTGPVTSWLWDFGDGSTSTVQNSSHTYSTVGVFNVKLTISSTICNRTQTKLNYVTVSGVPAANFIGAPISGSVPMTVNFTDQTSGNPIAWSWNFGDGGTSMLKNPSHQYTGVGTYTVTLTATNACGADDETKVNYIAVSDCSPANIALGKPATASSSRSGYPPGNAVDGSTSTAWKSQSGGIQWLEVDLGSTHETDDAVIRWDGSNRAKDFAFQYWDGVNWVTLFSQTQNSSSTSIFSFALTCAQKFRVYMTKPNSSRYYIKELEINGCSCTSTLKANMGQSSSPVAAMPDKIVLHSNYPNPFNPSTNINFGLPTATFVTLKVYNLTGAEIATLVDGIRPAGHHTVVFDAKNLPSGVYFAVLQAGEVRQVQRLLLMR